ncbi:MAG: hypothetical protein A2W91_06545 [Bacteroidetes bacterium GWF2_38_335]|nr:MAG: hypothetical protein A2W91_06545 [Bacteroidetes bacterium GWF2_38_335]OFY77690.1 MAG: hypothetical protein A2281_18060 [Bacteroidetes bacterium RIFOXYA12_FULL_38_20]HBS89079.1 TonB-dependent receptor [Bacteroidales bacterium]
MIKHLKNLLLTTVVFTYIGVSAQTDLPDQPKSNDSIPVIELQTNSGDDENESDKQEAAGLLKASSDVFVNAASFTFSPARFRIRGYESEYISLNVNGMPVNDLETGNAFWSAWGGLNDATKNDVVNDGISASDFSFGGIGGSTNIIIRASTYRVGSKLTLSSSNRSYRNRLMYTHSTGLMDNNWAFTFSGSRRWAENGYVDGTFYDAWAYFFSGEKKLNNKHSLGFTVFGAPSKRGKQTAGTQEMFDLTGNNYYNPLWGYQDGKVRNSAVSNFNQPMMLASHYFTINEKSNLNTSLGYSFGRGGATAITWNDAGDPRPDYYRYLPSYWSEASNADETANYNYYTALWTAEESPQLNWDAMYNANYKNLYTVENANGEGSDFTGMRSIYMVEDRRNDITRYILSSVYNSQLKERIALTAGFNGTIYKSHQFKVVDDLLGGDFWLDIDKFADQDPTQPDVQDNDINTPNHVVEEGDIFGYDFVANVNTFKGFGQTVFNLKKIDAFVGVELSETQFWYTGNMANGKFPDNSFGDGEKYSFFNYAAKGGLTYKVTGRHFIKGNGAYLTRAPFFRDVYVSPRTRNHVIEGITSETVYSGDINYIYRDPFINFRLTYYYTEFQNKVMNKSFYHDDYATFVNYMMTDVDLLHNGAEFGVEAKASQTITIIAAGSKGDYYYNSRPNVTIARDNNFETLAEDRVVYLKGYKVGGIPQTAGTIGVKYNSPKYWFAGINVNYFDDIYIEPNPERRTAEALEGIYPSDPQWDLILEQEKLPAYPTLDFYGYKSWKFKTYYLGLYVAVGNILNRTDIKTGGYEQLRFNTGYAHLHVDNVEKFPSKYFYMFGRTYFVNLAFSF